MPCNETWETRVESMTPLPGVDFNPTNHTYRLDGFSVPSVTAVLAPIDDLSSPSLAQYLEIARQRGTDVHAATERHDLLTRFADKNGAWHPENPTVAPYLDAWKSFLADTQFEIHAVEQVVASKRHRYAGTLDRLGVLNGRRVVIDIKTGATLKPVMGIQLAAYQAAVNEGKPRDEQYPYRFICQLRKDGSYKLQEYKDKADFTVFLALLTIHQWRTQHG